MKVLDFIICDDIRVELANKHTIVGTYNDRLVLQAKKFSDLKLPLVVRLAFYLKLDIENEDRLRHIDFSFKGNAIEDFSGTFSLSSIADPSRPLVVVANGFNLIINNIGDIDVNFEFKDSQGTILSKLKPSGNFKVDFREIT